MSGTDYEHQPERRLPGHGAQHHEWNGLRASVSLATSACGSGYERQRNWSRVEEVAQGCYRMKEQHPRAGVPHHCLDASFHLGLVAMDRATSASGFPFAEGATGQASQGVAQQFLAIRAQSRVAFLVAAVDFNHPTHGFLLPLDDGQAFSFSFLHFFLVFVGGSDKDRIYYSYFCRV